MLWRGTVFHDFRNNKVESAFADHRTYVYKGKEVDQQVHLGFDLASLAGVPIVAANRGKVLFADELGIYGNCVIIDHGMGLQSLYAHLSSIEVKAGQDVDKAQPIGRSGMTGLAGGDHLHFTMLVNGRHGEPGRVVGLALDRGPHPAKAEDVGRHLIALIQITGRGSPGFHCVARCTPQVRLCS